LICPVKYRNGRAIPAFATAAPDAILVPMPTLEINAMLNRQTTLRNHLRRTRNLLLPRLLLDRETL
jgi:DNA-binding IclR family transcriptional regulator